MTPADYKAAREAMGLDREQLAELLGVHWRTVQNRELGKAPIKDENIRALRDVERELREER